MKINQISYNTFTKLSSDKTINPMGNKISTNLNLSDTFCYSNSSHSQPISKISFKGFTNKYWNRIDDEKKDKIIDLVNKYSISFSTAQCLTELSTEEYSTVIEFLNMGVPVQQAINFSSLKKEQVKLLKPLLEKGISTEYALRFISMGEEIYNNAIKLLNSGFNEYQTDSVCRCYDEQINQMIELSRIGFKQYIAISLGSLDSSQFIYAKKLYEKGINEEDIHRLCHNKSLESINSQDKLEMGLHFTPDMVSEFSQNGEYKQIFNSKEYKENKDLLFKINKIEPNKFHNSNPKEFIMKKLLGIQCKNELNIKEKQHFLQGLKNIQNLIDEGDLNLMDEEIKKLNLTSLIQEFEDLINNIIYPTETTKEDIKQFGIGFLTNNNAKINETIKSTNLGKYKKEGLPLKYPRKQFLQDLTDILNTIPEERKQSILNELNIDIQEDNQRITGYNGIINLSKLDKENETEEKVYNIANKFIKENEIQTGDDYTDYVFNSLIKGIPEFINIIGKKQHTIHSYSLDIHTLKVLQDAIKDPEYDSLENEDKTCLKLAILLHDISKREDEIDNNHDNISALYSIDIMKKFPFPIEIKDRIYEIIKNHNWNKKYNKKEISPEEVASFFRHKNDFKMAVIMTRSDLKNVSSGFYEKYKDTLKYSSLSPILKKQKEINSSGQLIFTSKIIRPELLPEIEYKGRKYKVINLKNINDNTDLESIGLSPETTKQNLKILIHMYNYLESFTAPTTNELTKIQNDGYLSCSLRSANERDVYAGREYGVSIEAENVNIGNADKYNQMSGRKKGFNNFSKNLNDKHYRSFIPKGICDYLNLTKDEYGELFKLISKYKYISQIKDDEQYKIGNKKLKGEKIKEAIENVLSDLANSKYVNEINIYNPKINAFISTKQINEIPENLLNYIFKNNLPVILI